MPLYIQNGKLLNKTGTLGTSAGCCCGGGGECRACAGACAYFVSVTSPGDLAITSGAVSCVYGEPEYVEPIEIKDPWILGSISGIKIVDDFFKGFASGSFSDAQNLMFSQGKLGEAFIAHRAFGRNPGSTSFFDLPNDERFYAEINASLGIEVLCDSQNYRARVSAYVSCYLEGNSDYGQEYRYRASSSFDLDSACEVLPDRLCSSELFGGTTIRVIDTPFSISADGDGTSLGSYATISEEGVYQVTDCCGAKTAFLSSHPAYEVAESAGQEVKDLLSASFSITARESCNPLP
jgi:hypothetical protein